MTPSEQLQKWLDGESIHNKERDECCPDFSCCRSELLATKEIRQRFVFGDDRIQQGLLGMFLARAIQTYKPKKKVHISDGSEYD